MKKLVAIRTPRTEDEARFVAFVDPSFVVIYVLSVNRCTNAV